MACRFISFMPPRRLISTIGFAFSLILTASLGGCATNTHKGADISLSPPFASAEATAAATGGIIPEFRDRGPQYLLAIGDGVNLHWNIGGGGAKAYRSCKIAPSGFIESGQIGRVKIAGLTVTAAQAAIQQALNNYDGGPHEVTLTIVSSPVPNGYFEVAVFGMVNHPGSYLLPEDTPKTVLDLVTVAGPNRLSILYRIKLRRTDSEGTMHDVEIDLRSKTGGRFNDPNANIVLQPRDEVLVDECFCLL